MRKHEHPFVSVILCFYNEEKFLSEAVNSVMTQTHTNWELLLVDDGSSDGSVAIAREFAGNYPDRITYLEHPRHANKGLSASRHVGIRHATGQYIAFIDADDVWLPEKLTKQLAIFHSNPEVTVILEASNYWKSYLGPGEHDTLIKVGAREGVYNPPQLIRNLYPLGKGAAPCPSGIIVHKLVFDRCYFEESFRGIYQMYEDQAFLCKVYLNEKVFVSEDCNNLYRQRPSSLVSSVHETGKYHQVRSFYLRWFREYFNRNRFPYREVERLLDKALLRYDQPLLHKLTIDLPQSGKDLVAKMLVKIGILNYRKSW